MSLKKLHPRLQDFVKDKKWRDLTPIQKEAFDPIFNGESCTVEAPTSGGKTEAVLFPLLTRISTNKTAGFKILYVAPLKALLNDLALRIIPYAKMCYMEAFKWHGDVSQQDKIQQMVFPSDILLTTPESLEAILLRKSNWQEVFQNVETIVIDEAHYFALTERGSHLIALLARIESQIKNKTQRIAVTATIGNPGELLKWIMNNQTGGCTIKVTNKVPKEKDFKVEYFLEEGAGLQDRLYQLLTNKKSIVFERSRSRTEETAARINERNSILNSRVPVKVKTHHSSVSKQLREDAEKSIKRKAESSVNAIISTSTLELGIDIGELDQVIQIEGLNSSGSFLQRVGRTGRRSDKPQYFRGLCADPEQLVLLTGCVSLGLKGVSESIRFPQKAFHILSHQIICLCLQMNGIIADQAWDLFSKVYCFNSISRTEFDELIECMIKEDFLRLVDESVLVTGSRTEAEFLRGNWRRLFAIFDSSPMYNVVDGKKVIGTLDSEFAKSQDLPFIFILGGQEWNATKIDHETQQVLVKKNDTGLAPKWNTIGNYDIPYELSQEVGLLLMNNQPVEFLNPTASQIFQSERQANCNLKWNSDKWIFQASSIPNKGFLWTFAGDKINRAIAALFSTKQKTKPNYNYMWVSIEIDEGDDGFSDKVRNYILEFRSQDEKALEQIIENSIDAKWFSKFSACLPGSLAKKAIREKGYDIVGMIRSLDNIISSS